MFVFQAKGLQKEIDGKTIFKNIDLSILGLAERIRLWLVSDLSASSTSIS